ncbi:acyltransferase [Hymenobacter sp. BT664]|uniref:Acyltransferase n=2 Tax=Hymenobacter montanus TaxID=2771359 RepID=A0A927GJ05_9BACT|nr:acyltransferase [Hymenobacter montanus]
MAALYVLAFHTALMPTPQLEVPAWSRPLLLYGGSGVTLFFVISAFTLCLTMDGRQNAPYSTRNFYVRRILRIVPLYYMWLAIRFALDWGLTFTAFRAYKVPLLLYAVFGYSFVPGHQEGLVWASWALGIEVIFYLLFPFVFRVVTTLQRAGLFLIGTCMLAGLHSLVVYQHPSWVAQGYKEYFSLFSHLPVFAVGMVTYFLYKKYRDRELAQSVPACILTASVLAFFAVPNLWSIWLPMDLYPMIQVYLIAVVYAALVWSLSFFPKFFLINRTSLFFGTISYSLYLNHPQLVYKLTPVYQTIYAWPVPHTLHYLTCLLVTLVPLVGLSYLTYRLVELPFMNLTRHFIRKPTLVP